MYSVKHTSWSMPFSLKLSICMLVLRSAAVWLVLSGLLVW